MLHLVSSTGTVIFVAVLLLLHVKENFYKFKHDISLFNRANVI